MTDRFDSLASALSDRYQLERELGVGGMATVYLARDLRHDRRVAIKVLRPELAAVIGAERFLAEIRTTANLQHPHILPLFDSGKIERPAGPSLLYYVMPYVEGESLRDRLRRDGPLPVDEAVRLGAAVATALDYAHRRGVIHRDIKPENILLQDEHALVADFGIALATDAAGGDRLTETGLSLGTPQYMSPEQALGQRGVDGRTDLYALGVLLYEALTGAPPFAGPTAQAIVARVLTERPVPPIRHRRDLPPWLDDVILTALEREPERRFQSATDLHAALRGDTAPVRRRRRWSRSRVAGTAVLAGLALLALGWRLAGGRAGRANHSIVALPFENYSGDSADAYLADGIPQEILGDLAGAPGLVVRPMPQDRRFRDHPDLVAIRGELQAAIILTGTVLRQGDSIRVMVRPYDARANAFLPSVTFTSGVRNIFELEDGLSRTLLARLGLRSAPSGAAARRARPENPAAHDSLLLASWYTEKRDCLSLNRALSLLQSATRLDPAYAAAWADLAQVHSLRGAFFCASWLDESASAREAVQHSLRLDTTLAKAHMTLGFIDVFADRDWPGAAAEFSRAVALDSASAEIWLFRSWYYVGLHRLDSARLAIRHSATLDPSSSIIATRVGTILYFSDSAEAAAAQLAGVLNREPGFRPAILQLAAVDAWLERCAAVRALERQFGVRPADDGALGWALGRCGEGPEALRLWTPAPGGDSTLGWYRLGMIHAAVGDSASMFRDLDRAISRQDWQLWQLGVEPAFWRYHGDPAFQALLRRVHLPVTGEPAAMLGAGNVEPPPPS